MSNIHPPHPRGNTVRAEQLNRVGLDDVVFLDVTVEKLSATVCLPKVPPQVIDRATARKALANKAAFRGRGAHWKPLMEAARDFACSILCVFQGNAQFTAPKGVWIAVLGDDAALSLGPQAFHRASLEALVKAADRFIIVASGPEMYCYSAAATHAARDRRNVILIEALPAQLKAWEDLLKELRGDDLSALICLPLYDDADAESREQPEYCEAD